MADDEVEFVLVGQPIPDDGFSDRVMRRIAAHRRRRRMLLGGAALAGAGIALPSLPALASLANTWALASLTSYSMPAITTTMVLASIALGAWLLSLLLEAE